MPDRFDWGRDPVKNRAHQAVLRAVKAGRLVTPDTCSECSQVAWVVAHHDDHSKPLDVRWLCRRCHALHHFALRQAAA